MQLGDHYRRVRRLKRAAVRWSRVAYAAEAQTTTRGSLAVSAGALEIANVMQGALEVF